MAEYFEVQEPTAQEPLADEDEEDEECQLVPADTPIEPDDEDLDDADLAAALGARHASKASLESSLAASLHTGLTEDLEKVKVKESPEVKIVTPPARVLATAEKQQKIQALKHPGMLGCLNSFRIGSIAFH